MAVPPSPLELSSKAKDSIGEWYFQEPTTQQPAGPWTVQQLCERWRRDVINGLTRVWRQGQDAWRPLAEVQELKAALQQAALEAAEPGVEEEGPCRKRPRRTLLDEVPLTHTYTSEQGVLYVYDIVDADWKASHVYEALIKEEADLEAALVSASAAGQKAAGGLPPEAEEALQELLADAAASAPAATAEAGGSPAGATARRSRWPCPRRQWPSGRSGASTVSGRSSNGKPVSSLRRRRTPMSTSPASLQTRQRTSSRRCSSELGS